jgi:hypothetical protein
MDRRCPRIPRAVPRISPPPQVHGYDAPAYPNYLITSIGGFAFGIR